MAKPTQKKEVFGYGLWIRRYGGQGVWERQGFLFNSKYDALAYQRRHFQAASAVKVCAIRANVEPVGLRT